MTSGFGNSKKQFNFKNNSEGEADEDKIISFLKPFIYEHTEDAVFRPFVLSEVMIDCVFVHEYEYVKLASMHELESVKTKCR